MTLTFDIHIGSCNHSVNCIYIPSCKVIGLLVSGDEDFLRFLPYMGMAAILVM